MWEKGRKDVVDSFTTLSCREQKGSSKKKGSGSFSRSAKTAGPLRTGAGWERRQESIFPADVGTLHACSSLAAAPRASTFCLTGERWNP